MDFYCLENSHWKIFSLNLTRQKLIEKFLRKKCKRQWISWLESLWSISFNNLCPNKILEFLPKRHGLKQGICTIPKSYSTDGTWLKINDFDFVICCHWIINPIIQGKIDLKVWSTDHSVLFKCWYRRWTNFSVKCKSCSNFSTILFLAAQIISCQFSKTKKKLF